MIRGPESIAAAAVLFLAGLAAVPPADAVPGTVNVSIYYRAVDLLQEINASNETVTDFIVSVTIDAQSTGFQTYNVKVVLQFEIVTTGGNFPPAAGWNVTPTNAVVNLAVPPRGMQGLDFKVGGSVTPFPGIDIEPDFHTYATVTSDARSTTPQGQFETSLNLKLNNGTAGNTTGGSSSGGGEGAPIDLLFVTGIAGACGAIVVGAAMAVAKWKPQSVVGRAVAGAAARWKVLGRGLGRSSTLR